MLVVCALALVVAAAVLLVIGLAGGDVGDLYLSMALCAASLVVVAVSARMSRTRPAPASAEAPALMEPVGAAEAEGEERDGALDAGRPDAGKVDLAKGSAPDPAPTPAAAPADDGSIWAAGRATPAPAPQVEAEVAPEPQAEVEAGAPVDLTDGPAPPADGSAPFPIADYDDLAVAQVLPLVPRLWPEEVPVVAARERATKARPAVLDALAEKAGDPSLAFPIAEYESLDTEQITRLLDRLDAADLVTVQAAERSGPARVGVLVAVANQLATRR